MAKNIVQTYRANIRKKRKGIHTQNASKGPPGYHNQYKGQGKQR